MKVLFISSWYPNRHHKTLGNFVQKHAEAISRHASIHVLSVFSDPKILTDIIEHDNINGVPTTIVYYKKVKHQIPVISNYIKHKRYKAAFFKGVQYIQEQFGFIPDLTHVNVTFPIGLFALTLKRQRNIPYIVTEHWTGFLEDERPGQIKGLKKWSIRKILRNATYLTPVTEHLGNAMLNFISTKAVPTVRPIYNVVDTQLFFPKTYDNQKAQILHVSSLEDAHKNITGLLRVIKRISEKRKDFFLQIVTDGHITPLKTYAKELGIDEIFVKFESTKTPEEIVQYYQKSDFFLLFSNYENLPCVIVESLSCGKPIISSDVGGIAEHISKDKGILVEKKDETALEKAVETMLDNYKRFDHKMLRTYAEKKL